MIKTKLDSSNNADPFLSSSWSSVETLNSFLNDDLNQDDDDDSIWSAVSTLSSSENLSSGEHQNETDDHDHSSHYLSSPLRHSLSRRSIPIVQDKLKLTDIKTQQFQNAVSNLLKSCFPELDMGSRQPAISRLSGAMTNCVYVVSVLLHSPYESQKTFKAIMRVYGESTDSFIQRDHEMLWFCRMADLRVGPRLLAVFQNGRFEEFLESDTLTKQDLRDPDTSEQIAAAIQTLHSFESSSGSSKPMLWSSLRNWLRLVWSECQENPDFLSRLQASNVSLPQIAVIIGEKEAELESKGTIVFSHNDLQYGNILRLRNSGELILVDFEYSGYSYREYDLANHFCEWAADYHCDSPHLMNFERFPTRLEQRRFLNAYLSAAQDREHSSESTLKSSQENQISSPSPKFQKDNVCDTDIEELQELIAKFVPCSHILWGLWGLYHAVNLDENIDFDYFGYALERLRHVLPAI